jgi:hypothetical protein
MAILFDDPGLTGPSILAGFRLGSRIGCRERSSHFAEGNLGNRTIAAVAAEVGLEAGIVARAVESAKSRLVMNRHSCRGLHRCPLDRVRDRTRRILGCRRPCSCGVLPELGNLAGQAAVGQSCCR